MDRVASVIQQVNNGSITDYDAIKQLEYFLRSEESNQYKTEKRYLIQEHTQYTGDPLDIIIERERIEEIYNLIVFLLSHLSLHYQHIFYLYVVENYTMKQIGEKFGISKQAVHTYIKRIRHKLRKYIQPKHKELLYRQGKETFSKYISIGYPHEIANKKFIDAKFTRSGDYKARYECGIKEYLDNSFGDTTTVCTLCHKMCGS